VRRLLLHHVVYFYSMSAQFDAVDTTGDRRIDFTEFVDGVAVIDTGLSAVAARAEFSRLANGGSFVLFEDFCSWCAHRCAPLWKPYCNRYYIKVAECDQVCAPLRAERGRCAGARRRRAWCDSV
jgi:hypothetical protein